MPDVVINFIPSPCIKVCKTGVDGLCEGCFRTLEERQKWNKMWFAEQKITVELLRNRRLTKELIALTGTKNYAKISA